MDILENILAKISEVESEKADLLKRLDATETAIAKLEQMYTYIEDPVTSELMQDVVLGVAVQNGSAVPDGNAGGATGEKHYLGMRRVRDYVTAMQAGSQFTVHDVYVKSIEHMPSNPKMRHPEFEKQRKASISLALTSMAKGGDLEIVKQGRGRECTVYRKAEGK